MCLIIHGRVYQEQTPSFKLEIWGRLYLPFCKGSMVARATLSLSLFRVNTFKICSYVSSHFFFLVLGLEITVMTSFLGFGSTNIPPGPSNMNCKVDGELLTTNISHFPQNSWPICTGGNLTDGEHTLTINISSPEILFDYILYAPLSPTKMLHLGLTDASTRIEASDLSNTTMVNVPTAIPPEITSTGSSHNNRDMIIGIALGAGIFLLTIVLFLFKYLDLNLFNLSLSVIGGNCMLGSSTNQGF